MNSPMFPSNISWTIALFAFMQNVMMVELDSLEGLPIKKDVLSYATINNGALSVTMAGMILVLMLYVGKLAFPDSVNLANYLCYYKCHC